MAVRLRLENEVAILAPAGVSRALGIDWRRPRGGRAPVLPAALLPAAMALSFLPMTAGCRRAAPAAAQEVVVARVAELPEDPFDPSWEASPERLVGLLLQDMVEPRLLRPSTPNVSVRALTDGSRLALLLRWSDPTRDDLPGAARFVDACAIQFPAAAGADVPAPQMGEAGKGVEVTLWRASWQALADGRGDSIRELYPAAAIDHYPFEAPVLQPGSPAAAEAALRYAPARALGNSMEGPRRSSVED
ncbi:MAG: ethylbenzene dehydrogenase-related protein, partial [Planctomycetota bacterium]